MSTSKTKHNSPILVLVPLLFVALVVNLLNFTPIIANNKPNLILLILLFFSVNFKFTFLLEVSWVMGIILDLLSGMPLGVNALSLCVQVYLISTQFSSFKKFSMWQQTIIIGVISLLINTVTYWIEHIFGQSTYDVNFLIPSITTAIFWPIIYVACYVLCNVCSVEFESEKESMNI